MADDSSGNYRLTVHHRLLQLALTFTATVFIISAYAIHSRSFRRYLHVGNRWSADSQPKQMAYKVEKDVTAVMQSDIAIANISAMSHCMGTFAKLSEALAQDTSLDRLP